MVVCIWSAKKRTAGRFLLQVLFHQKRTAVRFIINTRSLNVRFVTLTFSLSGNFKTS